MLPYSNKTMKNKYLIIFFLITLIISCKEIENPKITTNINKIKDTIRINCKECIIDLKFNNKKLNKLKEKYSNDDFYIIADDANNYTSNVRDFLGQEKKEIIKIKMNSNNVLKINNRFIIPYEKINYWDYILCLNSTKPKIVSPIEFIDVYQTYYIDKIKSIKPNWIGSFNFFNDLGKIGDSGIFIGYNINISKDSILFSGQGYQTNFYDLCYAKQNKDTLELYYKKTIEGTDYNKKEKKALFKLYIKNSNYYGKSPVIFIESINNTPFQLEKND